MNASISKETKERSDPAAALNAAAGAALKYAAGMAASQPLPPSSCLWHSELVLTLSCDLRVVELQTYTKRLFEEQWIL